MKDEGQKGKRERGRWHSVGTITAQSFLLRLFSVFPSWVSPEMIPDNAGWWTIS